MLRTGEPPCLSRLALRDLNSRVPAHDARGALELGLLRAGRADHLGKHYDHDLPLSLLCTQHCFLVLDANYVTTLGHFGEETAE